MWVGENKIINKKNQLSKFLRRSLMIFIIKGFWTVVFIFIVISTFQPICPPAFFRCLSNLETFTEFQTTSFIESVMGGVACSDSICHKWVQVLSIFVLLLACSQDWTSAYNHYAMCPAGQFRGNFGDSELSSRWHSITVRFPKLLKKARGHIGWNVVEMNIKMKTIVQKPLMIKKRI